MSTTVAQLSADSKIAISLKKLQGKAHTKNDNELYNEGLPSGITMDSTTIFGVRPPENPTQDLGSITNDVVEKVRLVVEFIPGSDSTLGRHGFKLKLPSDYEATTTNPKVGTGPFVNDQVVVESNGALQLVPPQYHYLYEAKPYYGAPGSLTQIPLADPRDWNLDYFNGVIFQQDPYGPGDHAQNPTFVDAYIYIGAFLDTVVGEGGGGTGTPVNASFLVLNANAELDSERILTVDSGLTKTDEGAGQNLVLGIDDSVVATISGSTFTGDISAPNITGTESITSPELHGANLFLDDGVTDTWVAGNNVEIVTDPTTGQRTINTLGGDSAFIATNPGYLNTTSSVSFAGDLTNTHETTQVGTDVYFFVSGSQVDKSVFGGDVVISGSLNVDGGVNVGPVNYTNGYFTDIDEETQVGTAISQMNDLLRKLAPAEAPRMSSISEEYTTGVNAKLSFGNGLPLTDYTSHTYSPVEYSLALDYNGLFETDVGNDANTRLGVYGSATNLIGGIVGDNAQDFTYLNGIVNYPDYSFGKGNEGTLSIDLNGSSIHSINLTDVTLGSGQPGAGTGIETNGNGTGFVSLSAIGVGKFQNGTDATANKIRTCSWQISQSDWRQGYNYARVVHTIGAIQHVSNWVEWIYDADASNLVIAGQQIETETYTGELPISGIKYFSTGSVTYATRLVGMYKNVYPIESNAISFVSENGTTSGIEIDGSSVASPSVGVPAMVASDTPDKILGVTGSIDLTPTNWLLNEGIAIGFSATHPLKVDVQNGGVLTTPGALLFQDLSEATATLEDFHNETHRVEPHAFGTQTDVSNNGWDSSVDRSGGGHLIVQAGQLKSPLQSINGGNFLNLNDGGTVERGPDGNVDYSGITGTLEYYRKVQNNTGSTMFNFTLAIEGDGLPVSASSVLDTNKFKIFAKLPAGTKTNGQTGWCDLTKDFYTGQYSDDDGLLKKALDTTMPLNNRYTFGTNGVGIDDHFIIKIIVDASWTGHFSSMSITWDTVRYVFNN